MDQHEVVVKGVRDLTPSIREFVLASSGGAKLPAYEPGAHIQVEVSGERRDYSLIGGTVEADDPPDTYRIAVERKHDGKGVSRFMVEQLAPDHRLVIAGLRNEFTLNTHPANRAFIAGGIGITPIYSMVRALAKKQMPFALHYLGTSPEEMPYREDIERLTGGRAKFHYAGGDKLALDPIMAALHYPAEIYVCASYKLNQAVVAAALDHGLSNMQIMQQCFDPPPPVVREETGFEVELKRTGLVVSVPPDASILETLLSAGYPAKFYCGRGECGFCPLPVIESDGPIDHRDHFLGDEEKANDERVCICVSRIKGARLVLDA
jgi:ferredoxin-NADP reductase